MQSVLDSLCRCFGTPVPNPHHHHHHHHHNSNHGEHLSTGSVDGPSTNNSVPSTPDMKRRTRSLALQDKQWDALFSPRARVTPPEEQEQKQKQQQNGRYQHRPEPQLQDNAISLEQAQAVAKAKLAAGRRSYKRKRSGTSRDDIFRSKKSVIDNDVAARAAEAEGCATPFSRFLSKHSVLAHSLCFATPVRDSDDEADAASVFSDSNTLNTAEDTITSTVYYEMTRLKGLHQTTPPMPLYNTFQVHDSENEIHRIVETRSHSSAKLRDFLKQELQQPTRHNNNDVIHMEQDDTVPPPMTKMSSDSSKSAVSSHRSSR